MTRLNCMECRVRMAWKNAHLVMENEKLRRQNERLINILKNDDDISWYSKSDDEKLFDIFPDEEEIDD